jgi:hypothetical protein
MLRDLKHSPTHRAVENLPCCEAPSRSLREPPYSALSVAGQKKRAEATMVERLARFRNTFQNPGVADFLAVSNIKIV